MAWKKGQSGNPKGRKRNPALALEATVYELRRKILNAGPALVDALIVSANGGDMASARMLLACCVPPLRPIEGMVRFPLPVGASLIEQGRAILAAIANGDIAPGQATAIITALAAVARLTELAELESRIAALEGKGADGEPPEPAALDIKFIGCDLP